MLKGEQMSQLSIEKADENGKVVLKVSGTIDEDANFSGFELSGGEVILDLQNVDAINSCGIREWINWLKEDPGTKLVYRNCPKIIVDQVNMVSGFLPENAEMESFYVPYYCDDSGNEKMVLFTKGKEFSESGVNPPEAIKDDESGEEMEIDVIEAKYFRFLNKGA